MLQNGSLEASWRQFPAWTKKCSKTAFWKPPGANFQPGSRNAPKLLSGNLLAPIASLEPEMLQNGSLEISWRQFQAWSQKCTKIVLWTHPGASFQPGAKNVVEWFSGTFLARFLYKNSSVCLGRVRGLAFFTTIIANHAKNTFIFFIQIRLSVWAGCEDSHFLRQLLQSMRKTSIFSQIRLSVWAGCEDSDFLRQLLQIIQKTIIFLRRFACLSEQGARTRIFYDNYCKSSKKPSFLRKINPPALRASSSR